MVAEHKNHNKKIFECYELRILQLEDNIKLLKSKLTASRIENVKCN